MDVVNEGMTAYTQWWIAHPWHVSGTPESGEVPDDCDCDECQEESDEQRASAREGD